MTRIRYNTALTFSATITLSEIEIRALDALIGYGADAFIKVFYEKFGKSYMEAHEAGLRSFFKTVSGDCLPALHDIDQIRRDLEKAVLARHEQRTEAGAAA